MEITGGNVSFVHSLRMVRSTFTDSHANHVFFRLPGPAILFIYFVLSVRLLDLSFMNTDNGHGVFGWIETDA